MSSSVQPQWELSRTSFDTAAQLRDLIGIASQPNVQPQAVLAAEQLGFGLIVSPERINEAIVALGGNNSTRVEAAGVFIGLKTGDLQRIIRESTPLLQFFLAFTACKPCFEDTELGDIAFEMMVQTSILKRYPVASSQLAQLIRTFSSHSESIVPISVMQEIAIAVDEHNPGPDLYSRMEPHILAKMLVYTFERLRDETVKEILLSGHSHGVWLATFFTWLLPENVQVTVDKDKIRGCQGMKLTVEIRPDDDRPWEIQVYKADGDLTSYVFESDKDDMAQLHRLPIEQAKHYFNQYYCSGFEDHITRQKAIIAMGAIAGAMTCLLAENGTLFLPRTCCEQRKQKCATTRVVDVMSGDSLLAYSHAVTRYGWKESSAITSDQQKMYYRFKGIVPELRSTTSPELAMELVREACAGFINDSVGAGVENSYIVDPATYIALDAIVTSTTEVVSGTRYFSPLTYEIFSRTDYTIGELLCQDGLDIQQFRSLAFTHLLPGFSDFEKHDLIVARNGYIAGMAVLWKTTTLQRDVFGIKYTQGHIEREGISYDRVREAEFMNTTFSNNVGRPISLFHEDIYIGLAPKTESLSFETRTSIQGSSVVVKHYIQRQRTSSFIVRDVSHQRSDQDQVRRKASWISSICVLATAVHVGRGHELTPDQERSLADQLYDTDLVMYWASAVDEPKFSEPIQQILKTSGNELHRFFAASLCYDEYRSPQECIHFVVRHNAPLLSCIHIAQQSGRSWLIAC